MSAFDPTPGLDHARRARELTERAMTLPAGPARAALATAAIAEAHAANDALVDVLDSLRVESSPFDDAIASRLTPREVRIAVASSPAPHLAELPIDARGTLRLATVDHLLSTARLGSTANIIAIRNAIHPELAADRISEDALEAAEGVAFRHMIAAARATFELALVEFRAIAEGEFARAADDGERARIREMVAPVWRRFSSLGAELADFEARAARVKTTPTAAARAPN